MTRRSLSAGRHVLALYAGQPGCVHEKKQGLGHSCSGLWRILWEIPEECKLRKAVGRLWRATWHRAKMPALPRTRNCLPPHGVYMSDSSPAVSSVSIPPTVHEFAAEKGAARYLDKVIDLARQAFPSRPLSVTLDEDAEAESHRYIAIDVEVADLAPEQMLAGQRPGPVGWVVFALHGTRSVSCWAGDELA